MGIFGWDYPPGCDSVPGDEDDPPCDVCGNFVDDCICPECPVCGWQGRELCYKEHGLIMSQKQKDSLAKNEAMWAEQFRDYGGGYE